MIRTNSLFINLLTKPSRINPVIKSKYFHQFKSNVNSSVLRTVDFPSRSLGTWNTISIDCCNHHKKCWTSLNNVALRSLSTGKDENTAASITTGDPKTKDEEKFVLDEPSKTSAGSVAVNVKTGLPTDKIKTATKIREAVSKVLPKRKREKFDHSHKSVDRNFVTAVRAMNEYLLKPSDLEGLRKTYRRSPYENNPPITVYLRRDVEAKSLEVWGSQEALAREIKKRQEQDRQYREHIFQIKLTVKEYRQNHEGGSYSPNKQIKDSLFKGSGRVVLTAVTINATNFALKLAAWLYTGSHSLFAEAVHSFADTCNQLILAYGVHKSIQAADPNHPYGYSNIKYVASLISGVGIFCVGTGISIYHGIVGLMNPEEAASLYWAFFILGGSLVSEGATLLIAINAIRQGSKKAGMSLHEYIIRAQDPLVNVVLLEDIAAVIGVVIAGSCMGLSSYLNSSIPDAIGSILIGGLLGSVAMFIISTNAAALVGRSIPAEKLHVINNELESDVMIRAIHDAKCIDMGSAATRYKAEIDFDGRELTRSYLDKQDLEILLEDMQKMKTIDEVENFMLRHGENVIDLVGAEIDRIESQLKKAHPEIRHCDLEIL